MQNDNIKLFFGDCKEQYTKIKPNSVDLILTDPPYGIIKGAKLNLALAKKEKHSGILP